MKKFKGKGANSYGTLEESTSDQRNNRQGQATSGADAEGPDAADLATASAGQHAFDVPEPKRPGDEANHDKLTTTIQERKGSFLGDALNKIPTGVPEFNTSLNIYAPLILVLYLLTGTLVYCNTEGWSFIESLYFCVVSLTTVGYGDFTPTTEALKLFTVLYIYAGLAFATVAAGLLVGKTLGRTLHEKNDVVSKYSNAPGLTLRNAAGGYRVPKKSSEPDKDEPPSPHRSRTEALRAFSIVVILGGIGTVFNCAYKGLTFVDSFYFTMITLAAVGYGDIDGSDNEVTMIFGIAFILVGVTLMGLAITRFAAIWVRVEQEKQVEAFVKKGVTMEVIEAMDADGSGEIERIEFLTYMLVHMGTCEQSDLKQINMIFDRLDADGGGTLDIHDLHFQDGKVVNISKSQSRLDPS